LLPFRFRNYLLHTVGLCKRNEFVVVQNTKDSGRQIKRNAILLIPSDNKEMRFLYSSLSVCFTN